jgi:CBS domain-containing protein
MVPSVKPLFALTAGDAMSRAVVTVPHDLLLREAARRLADAGVHGAPVVDGAGRLVGVLSVTDLARWAADQSAAPAGGPRTCPFWVQRPGPGGGGVAACTLPWGSCVFQRRQAGAGGEPLTACAQPTGVCFEWSVLEPEALPDGEVRHYMTPDPVTAAEAAPVPELARRMIDAAVHRLIVVDEQFRPVGVVSGTDLLAALARSTDAGPSGATSP